MANVVDGPITVYLHVDAAGVVRSIMRSDRVPVLPAGWTLLDAAGFPGVMVGDTYSAATGKITRPAALQTAIDATKLVV